MSDKSFCAKIALGYNMDRGICIFRIMYYNNEKFISPAAFLVLVNQSSNKHFDDTVSA